MDLDEVLAHHSGSLRLLAEAMSKASLVPSSVDKFNKVEQTLETLEDIVKQIRERIPKGTIN